MAFLRVVLCTLTLWIQVGFAAVSFPTQTSIPLKFDTGNAAPNGFPSTVITIQGKSLPLIFDTGAKKFSLVLTQQALKNIQVTYTGKHVCSKAMDGEHCYREFLIPEIKIGAFVIKNVKGVLMSQLWGRQDTNKFFKATAASCNGVIGFQLLSQFNVLLDYRNSKAILVKPHSKPVGYDVASWTPIAFEGHLLTTLKLNNKVVTLTWDTGATPSDINQTVAKLLQPTPCPRNNPYKQPGKCFRVTTRSFTTQNNQVLPNTWFAVQVMPAGVPFDGLVGSNFYADNLVYFDFDQHKIFVTSNFASRR